MDCDKDQRSGEEGGKVTASMEIGVFESPGKEWDEFASRYTDLLFYQSSWSEILEKGLGGSLSTSI